MDVQSNKQEQFIELGRRPQSQIRGGRQRHGRSNGDLPHAHFFSRWTVDLGAAGNKLDACPQEARELDVQHGDVPSLHVDGRLRRADAEADRVAWECSMDPACETKTTMDRAVFGVNESSRPQIVREMAPHPVSGKRRVTGEKDELKHTQEYPVDDAAKVFVEWSAHRDSRRRQVQVFDESDSDGDSDLEFALEQRPEARMEQVSAFMGMEPNELPAGLGMR